MYTLRTSAIDWHIWFVAVLVALIHISATWVRRCSRYIYLPSATLLCHSLPQSRPLMSSPGSPVLQQLNRLDRSLPNFQDQLSNVLYGQEYKKSMPNLEDDDFVWLVDYLSEVRRQITLPNAPTR